MALNLGQPVPFSRSDYSDNGAEFTLLRGCLNTWLWAHGLLVRGSKTLQKRENLIFSVEQVSLGCINILPCSIELQFIYLGYVKIAEVSFNSLSSVEYFPFYVSKLIISRIKSCFVRRKGGLTWLFFMASPLCGAAGEGIHQRVFVSLTFVGRRAP